MCDMADMMIDGTLCAGCGEFMSDSPEGYPGYCSSECSPDDDNDDFKALRKSKKQRHLRLIL